MTDMTQAPTPGPLWMMHVLGPDDIYPAPDHVTAVEWCAALNASMPASDVLCVAVPAIWIGTPEAHAEGLSKAVEGWTSPPKRLAPTAPVEASGSERDHRFVPGVMRCAKCNFVVVRRVFSAIDGTVGDGDNKTEPCPNGCGPLWPMTWEQNSRDMEERCEAAVLEAANLRAQLALRPQPSGETRDIASQNEASGVLGWFSALARKEGHHVQADWLDSYIASIRPAPVASGGQHSSGEGAFLGHLIAPKSGVGAVYVPKGEPVPLMDGRGSVTPVYSGPQNVTVPVAETAGEAVAWRWRIGDDTPWVISDRKPPDRASLQVQPLFASQDDGASQ